VALGDLLGAVAATRGTHLERVCWDLNVDESRVRPVWDVALRAGLIEATGTSSVAGSRMYALSDRGRGAVRELKARRRRPA
jgi:DNA-binding PadR family transcriptional regulator